MKDYISFPISCRLRPWKTETLYAYYYHWDGQWHVLDVNVCDNCGNERPCQDCKADVRAKAEKTNPEAWADPFRDFWA